MIKSKKITVIFTSEPKETPQTTAEEIAIKLVKDTLYKLLNG